MDLMCACLRETNYTPCLSCGPSLLCEVCDVTLCMRGHWAGVTVIIIFLFSHAALSFLSEVLISESDSVISGWTLSPGVRAPAERERADASLHVLQMADTRGTHPPRGAPGARRPRRSGISLDTSH